MVRAKFKVTAIERTMRHKWDTKKQTSIPQEVRTVKLQPVYGEEGENKAFWDASPSGSIELGCANLEAAEMFELEKEYYIEFSPAE